jgi:hypothetical protein
MDERVETGLQAAQDTCLTVQRKLDAALALCSLFIASKGAAPGSASGQGAFQKQREPGSSRPVHRWTRFLDSDHSILSEEDGHDHDERACLGLVPHRACPEGLGPEAMGHGASGTDDDMQPMNDTIDMCAASPVEAVAGKERMKLYAFVAGVRTNDRLAAGNKSLHAETALCLQDLERSPESKAMTADGGQIVASPLGVGTGAVNIEDAEQLRERALEAERMLKDMEMEVLMLVLQKEAVERQHAWEQDRECIKVMRLEQALVQSQSARKLIFPLTGFPTETSLQVSLAPDAKLSRELSTGAFHLGGGEEGLSPDYTDGGLTPRMNEFDTCGLESCLQRDHEKENSSPSSHSAELACLERDKLQCQQARSVTLALIYGKQRLATTLTPRSLRARARAGTKSKLMRRAQRKDTRTCDRLAACSLRELKMSNKMSNNDLEGAFTEETCSPSYPSTWASYVASCAADKATCIACPGSDLGMTREVASILEEADASIRGFVEELQENNYVIKKLQQELEQARDEAVKLRAITPTCRCFRRAAQLQAQTPAANSEGTHPQATNVEHWLPGTLAHENLAYSTSNGAGHSCSARTAPSNHSCSARTAPSNPFDLECGISDDPGGGGAATSVLYGTNAHVSRVSPLLAVEGVEGEEATCVTMDVGGISEGSVKADVVVMPQDWSIGSLPRGAMTRLCETGFEMPVDCPLVSPPVHPDAVQESKGRASKETKQHSSGAGITGGSIGKICFLIQRARHRNPAELTSAHYLLACAMKLGSWFLALSCVMG